MTLKRRGKLGHMAILVGSSLGAVVALETALRHQSSLAGLVLYEPPVAATRPVGGDALVRARAALTEVIRLKPETREATDAKKTLATL